MNDKVKTAAADVCPLFKEYGSCEKCDEEIDINDDPCIYQIMAKLFLEKDYRKASDIATEIFEEIEEMLNMQAIIVCETRKTVMKADEPPLSYMAMLDGRIYSIRVVEEHIAELKKKYINAKDTNVLSNTEIEDTK